MKKHLIRALLEASRPDLANQVANMVVGRYKRRAGSKRDDFDYPPDVVWEIPKSLSYRYENAVMFWYGPDSESPGLYFRVGPFELWHRASDVRKADPIAQNALEELAYLERQDDPEDFRYLQNELVRQGWD